MFRTVSAVIRTESKLLSRCRSSKKTPAVVKNISALIYSSSLSKTAAAFSSSRFVHISDLGQSTRTVMTRKQVLEQEDGPLVWIDLEMTGLDVHKDEIMEIAVLITNGNLNLVDEGIQFIINVEKEKLDSMDEWCTRQHGSTGLTQACLESPHTLDTVQTTILDYVQKYIPEKRVGVLAGNSVHVDRMFLAEKMPILTSHLHYRIVDVSSIKELCRRWYNGLAAPKSVPENEAHRALADIHGSINELRWYRENVFRPSNSSQ